MAKKVIRLIFIILGGILLILSLTADLIGIGSYPGFNYAQILGAVVGLAALIFGIFYGRSTPEKSPIYNTFPRDQPVHLKLIHISTRQASSSDLLCAVLS